MKKFISQNLKIALLFFVFQLFFGSFSTFRDLPTQPISRLIGIAFLSSVLFLIFIMLYQLYYIKKNKISIEEYSNNPNRSATIIVDKNIEETKAFIETKLSSTLNASNFLYDDKSGFFKTKTGVTFKSWGENIRIKLNKIDELKTELTVFSYPVLKTTLFDFGKSNINIQIIKLAFNNN